MPYLDERAGLAAIMAIAEKGIVDNFRNQLVERHDGTPLALPDFIAIPNGKTRRLVVAIDGSNIYESIPGSLPCTEAGLVSLGVVKIDTLKLASLSRLPLSHSVNPRELIKTEDGETLAAMLPGRNAARLDGTNPRQWFREVINKELRKTKFGDESLAKTLEALFESDREIKCPSENCEQKHIIVTGPNAMSECPTCKIPIFLSDGLRIHEQFDENKQVVECHSRFRDALEILALMNFLRYLVKTKKGRVAIANTAFVLDGPLAAFGTIAVLSRGVQAELRRIQKCLDEERIELLVMSGIKSGPFVEHFAELDRAPEPNKRIPSSQYYIPNDNYIRKNIVAGRADGSLPWGELTYFGRPVFVKTANGQRLVLNLAQPEADPPLTEAPFPRVLTEALATADPLGVGAHQFQPLRRVHAQTAIPLRTGTDLIHSLAPRANP